MAQFGWSYVDCSDAGSTGSGSEGPPYSLQFVTESGGGTTGSANLVYYTASYASYAPSTIVLQGDMIVTGAISASTYHIEDIAVIDATGSTYFGDSTDDEHIRTGSFVLRNEGSLTAGLVFSASANSKVVRFYGGQRAAFTAIDAAATYTATNANHIIGVEWSDAVTITLPSASNGGTNMHTGYGTVLVIKDCVASRTGPGNNITLTGSPGSDVLIDKEGTYVLTGTMPAISLFSNGVGWFVF